jgi:nitrite reductase/ring-hydroxylating ferredoxin subunit
MPEEPSGRIDRIVADLLKGKRLKVGPADAAERKAILAAVRLAAAREGYPRMSPALRRRLAAAFAREEEPTWISRRTALLGGLAAAAGALVGVGLTRAGELSPAPATVNTSPTSPLVIDPRPGRWVDVGALADLPDGEGFRVKAGSVGAYLFRQGANVTAVSSICSHLPCELDWMSDRGQLNCPCHDQAFNRDGSAVSKVYPLPNLPAVQVKVVDGRVLVFGT